MSTTILMHCDLCGRGISTPYDERHLITSFKTGEDVKIDVCKKCWKEMKRWIQLEQKEKT